MFDVHSKEKVVEMFVAYCDPSEKFEPITKWEFDVEGQPANNIEEDDDDYLRNPLPENEHVGVDEEIMYLDIVPVNAVDVPGCSEKGRKKQWLRMAQRMSLRMAQRRSLRMRMN